MNAVSAGEICVGMYIVVIEVKVFRSIVNGMTGMVTDENFWTGEHWYKGIPFRVINVNGPIVAVDTARLHPSLPPVAFFDTRTSRFIETDRQFFEEYVNIMKGGQQLQFVPVGLLGPGPTGSAPPPAQSGDPVKKA